MVNAEILDDSMLPGELFNIPLFMIIDSLAERDPITRQMAENWIRSNLQSYTRILDPVLSRLMASDADYDTSAYMFNALSTVLRSASGAARETSRTTELSRSVHPTIVKKAEDCTCSIKDIR
jgi:hypothetical protein